MNLRGFGASPAQLNQSRFSSAAAPSETAKRRYQRGHRWAGKTRLFVASALAALSFAVPTSFAATTTVSVLIDGDNNLASGCTVATVNGPFAGVDRVLNSTVVADGAGYRTQSISLQVCSGGTLGVAQVIDSSALPIARGNGAGGSTAIETFVPNSFLPAAGQKMRVGVTSVGADGLTGSDALTLNGTGPILVDGPPLLIVPTLATASLALTALLLVGSLWLARRRGWNGMQLVVVMVFALSLSGQLIAAIVRDGLIADWTGIAPVATDATGDAPPGADIINLYSTVENGNVFFRIDTMLNSPPAANAQTVTAMVGTPLAITLTGSDFEASPLTFTVVTQPTQGVLTGTAPNLTYTPNALATASDSFTFKVNDGSVDSASATVTIGNTRAPSISSANNAIFIPTQANTFAFAANGLPTPTASFGACSPALPSVTFAANTSGGGTLSGSPAVAEAGVHTCTFTAANGVLPNATQTFTLTVGGGPTITSAATISVPELAAFTHTVTTSSVLPITGMTSVGALPTGATFAYAGASATTATISGTPAVCSRGTYPVTLGASNSVASSSQSFNLTVRPVNQMPSFTKGADVIVLEDAAAQTVAGWATARNAGAACESTQALSFEIVSNSNAALFGAAPAVNGSNGDLTFTPAANANGTATLTVRIKDNGGTVDGGVDSSATQSFVINVSAVNDAPGFAKGADVTVLQNATAQTVTPWATAISSGPADEAAQTVSFQIVGNTNAALFSVGPAISPTGTLTFTPATNQPGTATVTVNLKDSGGTANGGIDTSATQTFTITVTAVNQVPSFTKGADVTVLEDAGAQTVNAWATAISPGPASEAAQTVAFQMFSNSNAALFSNAPAVSPAGVLTYTAAANACGSAAIVLNIKDNGGTANGGVDTSATQSFSITVTCVNDAPVFVKGADVSVLQNAGAQTIANWATGIGSGGGADEAGQSVGFNVSNTNNALFSVQPTVSNTGTLAFTPNPAAAGGTATVTVVAQDNGGTANGGFNTSAAQTFTITVRVAPTITSAAATTFGVGSAGSFTFTASGSPAPTFALTACSPALPASITAAGSLLSGTPVAGQSGVYNCTLTASNAAGSATQAFALTIAQAPVAVADGGSVLAGATLTVPAPGLLGNDQLSVPPATLTFFGGGSLSGAVTDNAAGSTVALGTGALQVTANGGMTFTPNTGFIGSFTFSYRIANSQGTSDALVTIDVNRAPLFTGATTGTLQAGTAGSVAFSATGWPAPAVNTAACTPALPASVTAASTTAGTSGTITFSGTPSAGDAGTYSCPLTASNIIAPAATQTVTITIASAPTFTSANSVNFVVGTAKTFNIVTTGIPAATLTNPGGCALPAGLTLSVGAATVSGTATATGTASCNLVATNVAGTANQALTVNVLQAPSFAAFGPYNLTAGNTAAFSATATGVPLPVITQTAGALPAGITVGSNPAGTINFGGTPSATGTFPITLSATNTASTVTQAASISVTCPTLTVTPTTVSNPVVGTPFSQAFAASGMNNSTFVWTATGLPAVGLSISATTGVVSGTPTVAGPISFTVAATGAAACGGNTGLINATVNQAPAFTSANSATFTVGTLDSFTAAASGSPAPTVTGSCAGLPSGVTLAGATLSGTPAANTGGSYPAVCTFNASNGVGPAVAQTFSLTVNQALAVTSSASAALALNQPGSFTITTSGFPATNGITLTAIPGPGACVLPTGLTFSYGSGTTATISGTATTSTPVTCLVTALNGVSTPATQNLTIVAATAPVAVNDSLQTLQNTTLSTSITINDTPGVPPPTITFGGGSLPGTAGTNAAGTLVSLAGGVNNFTIDSAGVLTLTTPPTVGTYTVNYRLTNISGSSDGIITIIVGTAPTLTGSLPGTAIVGTPYTATLTSGGSPVPTTSLQGSSTLPAGLTLSGNTVSGTPTSNAAGPFTGSLIATNTFGTSSPAVTYSISVSCPALTVNPVTVTGPVINTAYSPPVTFTGAGLTGTYTWAGTAGVPAGMTVSTAGVFSGTPTVSGAQSMTVTGTHTSGCQATRIFAFTITVPPPVVTTSGNPAATFTEAGASVVIDSGITVISSGTATLASGTVTLTTNAVAAEDVLGFVAVPATMGNVAGSYAAPILTLTSAGATATVAQWQVALRAVTYSNSSQNPSTLARSTSFVVNNGSSTSAPATKTVNVVAVNDAPVLTNGSTISYTESAAVTAINTAITVTDVDSVNLSGATVSLTSNFNSSQDVLSYATALGITGTYTAATGVLALSGTTTLANYQTALRNVKYNNTSNNPTLGARTVTFVVTDGVNASNAISSSINITAVNDAPSALAKSYGAQTNMKLSITAANGLLFGATDPDGLATSLTVGTVSAISPVGGTLTVNMATGAFDFAPPPAATGNVTFTYTVCDNGVPAPVMCSAAATATVNVTGPVIWFVNSAAAAGGNGTLASPFNTLAAADAVDAVNHGIFLYTGTYTTGLALNSGESLIGQGVNGASFDAIFGISPPAGTISRPAIAGARPTVQGTVTLNTNSTVRGLNLSTGASTGLSDPAAAITGVTVSEVGVTATTGTAVNLNGVGGSISLTSVSSTGAASGIVLNNTTGSFAVTGTGTANSGGTIQSTSGHGVNLTTAQNVSLDRMNIQSTAKSGINGTGVTNFAFTNGTINNSGTAAVVGVDIYSNIAFNNNNLVGNNVNGTLTVTDSTLTNAYYSGLSVYNNAGTISDAVITGNTITSSTSTATSKGYGIELVGNGNASTVGNLTKATISNNVVSNFPSGGGVQVLYGNVNATGPRGEAGTPNNATNIVNITNNTIKGETAANRMNTNAILFSIGGGNSAQRSRGNANISCNGRTTGGCTATGPLTNVSGHVIGIGNNGFADTVAVIDSNTVVANHPVNSTGSNGISGGNGIVAGCALGAGSCETPDLTVTVTNNNISQTDGNGILLASRGNLGLAKLGVRNNTVAAPLGGTRPGIRIDAGNNTANSDDVVCLSISGNTSAGSGTNGLGIRKQGTVATTHDFGIVGLPAGTSSGATATALVTANNPAGNGTLLISGDNFSTCNTAP